MNRYPIHYLAFAILFFALTAIPMRATAQNRETRDKIDRMAAQLEELKTEVTLLQRQIQMMQETFNKTSGELNTLIVQMSDNISAVRRSQSSISTSSTETASQVGAMGERLTATNQRMERLSEQFAQLKKLIEDIPKMPTIAQVTPGNAEQLFAAAYSDYSRGNYDLALSEFRQYVESYPGSELSDNAQYWIGEIFFAQKKFAEAAAEFEKVATLSPNGDKASLAVFKRGLVLAELGRKDEAIAQFQTIIRTYPRSNEASLATQQLQQLAPGLLTQPAPQPERSPARKPRKP
jgi:tol-pal system protein YbgF